MRLDRFITLNIVRPWRSAFRRLVTPNFQHSTIKSGLAVPILMYHSISDDPEAGVSPYYRVNTSPARFREHMRYLADHGYRTISLSTLVSWLSACPGSDDGPVVRRRSGLPVVITFDDGFRDFYTEAFPVLQEFGFSATMFLPTAFIGGTHRRFRPVASGQWSGASGRECLSWAEVRELHQAGICFGSHTVNHPKLVELPWPKVERELRDSKTEIEQRLQTSVSYFCYPYAFPQQNQAFCARFRSILTGTNYTCCATTIIGNARKGSDPLRLSRLPINSQDEPSFLEAKLDGAYDWLAVPQAAVKTFKTVIRGPVIL